MTIKIIWFILLVFAKRYYVYDFHNPKRDLLLTVWILVITLASSIYGALWIDKHCGSLFNYKIESKK